MFLKSPGGQAEELRGFFGAQIAGWKGGVIVLHEGPPWGLRGRRILAADWGHNGEECWAGWSAKIGERKTHTVTLQ
ncbi:hypothetical protein NBRC116593_23240 [Sulfitobacter pacificus]